MPSPVSRLRPAIAVASAGVLLAMPGCSSGRSRTAPTIVTEGGRIGTLQVGRSDAASVIALAGRPDADRRGRDFGSPLYRGLGYGCSKVSSALAFPLVAGGPYCRTVFFVNGRTRRLGAFFTTSPRYSEGHGVRIGMPTAAAERLLHARVYVGCEEYLSLGPLPLTVAFAGGRPRKLPGSSGLHLVGGHVYAFVVHSRDDVGVWDCL